MPKEIVVQDQDGEQAVAILEDGVLVEFYSSQGLGPGGAGSIYLARVINVLPGMEAAFLDLGIGKNGFLHIRDVWPRRPGRRITGMLRPGQEVVVQVKKAPQGDKGAKLTMRLALPGHYLVLLPGSRLVAVSKKIGGKERERLREMARQLLPANCGLIVRTAAREVLRDDLAAELQALVRLWQEIAARVREARAPALIHAPDDLIRRVLSDNLDPDDRLVVDSFDTESRVRQVWQQLIPGRVPLIEVVGTEDVLAAKGILAELRRALERKVWLKCGGYLVIDQAEALTCIDVNTGRYVGRQNLARTVLETNLEAAREIARQLRLRGIGGIIIIDFVSSQDSRDQEKVLAVLAAELQRDPVKTKLLGVGPVGLVEMTRQQPWWSVAEVWQEKCPCCGGQGRVFTEKFLATAKKE